MALFGAILTGALGVAVAGAATVVPAGGGVVEEVLPGAGAGGSPPQPAISKTPARLNR